MSSRFREGLGGRPYGSPTALGKSTTTIAPFRTWHRIPRTFNPHRQPRETRMHVVGFGTYDRKKHPRVGILLDGLRQLGDEVTEINAPLGFSTTER